MEPDWRDNGAEENRATRNVRRRINVLGVPVDAVDMDAVLGRVRSMLAERQAHVIAAVNPEKVIAAQRNPALLKALEDASLVIPDGIGVVLAARLLGERAIQRVAGSDLMPEICRLAAKQGNSVYLYGAKLQVVTRAAALLQQRFPGLKIAGAQHGYVPEEDMSALLESINASGADVLFVGLGSPRQELWMRQHRHALRVAVCQGVGGTFDAICGHPRRAPLILRRLNLEWLYRLVTQPQRLRRQSALPRFAMQVLRQAITGK